jgi:hypothetical protein
MVYDYGIYDPHSNTWFGDPATEFSNKYPECSQCHSKTRLKTPREMDNEGNIKPAVFECTQCGHEVPDPDQFTTTKESDDILGEILFNIANPMGEK